MSLDKRKREGREERDAEARIAPDPPALLKEQDDRFYVGTSTIPDAGQGLFARVPLAPGAALEVIGVLVARESVSDRCSHYTDPYKFRMNGALLIPVGYGAMVNHAVEANVEQLVDGGRLYLRALRSIAAGEEILLTYGGDATQRFKAPLKTPSGEGTRQA
jgi:SET domain-containing protein